MKKIESNIFDTSQFTAEASNSVLIFMPFDEHKARESDLLDACGQGDVDQVKWLLLQQRVNKNCQDEVLMSLVYFNTMIFNVSQITIICIYICVLT
jgi:hypothetical protein